MLLKRGQRLCSSRRTLRWWSMVLLCSKWWSLVMPSLIWWWFVLLVELGVAVSEAVKLSHAGFTPSSSIGPQQLRTHDEMELGNDGAARPHDEMELGNDGAARPVYTPTSSSSEGLEVEPLVTRSPQYGGLGVGLGVTRSSRLASSGQKGTSVHPLDPGRPTGARLTPSDWDDGSDAVWWGYGGCRGGEEHEGKGTPAASAGCQLSCLTLGVSMSCFSSVAHWNVGGLCLFCLPFSVLLCVGPVCYYKTCAVLQEVVVA